MSIIFHINWVKHLWKITIKIELFHFFFVYSWGLLFWQKLISNQIWILIIQFKNEVWKLWFLESQWFIIVLQMYGVLCKITQQSKIVRIQNPSENFEKPKFQQAKILKSETFDNSKFRQDKILITQNPNKLIFWHSKNLKSLDLDKLKSQLFFKLRKNNCKRENILVCRDFRLPGWDFVPISNGVIITKYKKTKSILEFWISNGPGHPKLPSYLKFESFKEENNLNFQVFYWRSYCLVFWKCRIVKIDLSAFVTIFT